VEFRILGPIEVLAEGEPVRLGGAKERSLLALLLLRAGEVVPSDGLIDELWGDSPPETAANALQVHVSHLRKALPGVVVTRSPGYVLELDGNELDLDRFQRLADRGRQALAEGHPEDASRLFGEALALWRGPALAGADLLLSGEAEAARLDELRLAAVEDRAEAELEAQRHAAVVPELERLVRAHPLRERLRAQLIVALYRSERQADALAVYRDGRRALDELGLEPGPALRELERAVLRHEETLASPAAARRELPAAPTPLVGREREIREAVALVRGGARLLTFTGPGGIGKTRLALEVAREVGADTFVDLTPIADAALVAPTIGRALGLAGHGGSAEDSLVAHLRERGGRLLLDNFEQLLDAAPLLGRLLASAPRLSLLVTSRAVLRVNGEREFAVPPLEHSTSLALFVDRSRIVAPDLALKEDDDAVAEICQRLDGVPQSLIHN
jgi:DNA-binding SARP family transcriptional activator